MVIHIQLVHIHKQNNFHLIKILIVLLEMENKYNQIQGLLKILIKNIQKLIILEKYINLIQELVQELIQLIMEYKLGRKYILEERKLIRINIIYIKGLVFDYLSTYLYLYIYFNIKYLYIYLFYSFIEYMYRKQKNFKRLDQVDCINRNQLGYVILTLTT